jgi:hypothetical protein
MARGRSPDGFRLPPEWHMSSTGFIANWVHTRIEAFPAPIIEWHYNAGRDNKKHYIAKKARGRFD